MSEKLSSLKVGIDVPWVTSWTAEVMEGAARCQSVGGRPALIQTSHAGYGKPQYSLNHVVRQRLTVTRMLCPMCGEPTPGDDRWTLTARVASAGRLRAERGLRLPSRIDDDQRVIDAGAIAPLHRDCACRSMKLCPHLRTDPALKLARFPKDYLVIPLMVPPEGDPDGPAVIGFLQLCAITATIDRRWRQAA